MNLLSLLVAAFVFLGFGTAFGAEQNIHLFILSGQSNMEGLDPNLRFTPAVQKEFGAKNVIVVKDALGGQPIKRWYKNWKPESGPAPKNNGDLYDRLMSKVNKAIEGKPIATITFVWMQGENDARNSWGGVYEASLRGLFEQLKTDLKRQDIGFVIGRISDFDLQNKRYPHWTMIRGVQVKVAENYPRAAWVDTDDLNGNNNDLHYTKDGYKTLGARFAEKAIALVKAQ